jgi:hypothetical protein
MLKREERKKKSQIIRGSVRIPTIEIASVTCGPLSLQMGHQRQIQKRKDMPLETGGNNKQERKSASITSTKASKRQHLRF